MGIGILLGGFLAEYISYSAAFWVTAAMQCAGTMMFLFFTRHFYMRRRLNEN